MQLQLYPQYWQYYLLGIYLTFNVFLLNVVTTPNKNLVKVSIVLAAVLLSLFAGLRDCNFTDYPNYQISFDRAYDPIEYIIRRGNDASIEKEALYSFLNTFFRGVSEYSWPLFLFVAAAAVGINLFCFYKFSPYPLLATLWYYSHLYLNKEMIQIRSGLGSALVVLGTVFIVRRSFVLYFIVVLCAGMIHTGALVALPMYFICQINFSKKVLLMGIFAGLALGASGWLDPFLGILKTYSLLPSRVENYQGSAVNGEALGLLNPITVKQVLVCVFLIWYKDFLIEKSKYFYPIFIMYIAATFWITTFQSFTILAARIATFLSAGDPVLITYLVYTVKEKRLAILALAAAAWMMLLMNLDFVEYPFYKTLFYCL